MLPKNVQLIARRIIDVGHQCFIVGGAVRNHLLNLPVKDYDLVTSMRPDQLQDLFKDQDCNLVGKSFGVVIVNGNEIATFRRDVYSADRMRVTGCDTIEFADTIEEDLSRRDFTINSIANELIIKDNEITTGKYVTATNTCFEDVHDGLIRFVGNGLKRIEEDPLRAIRAFRFAGLMAFNNGGLQDDAMAAIKAQWPRLFPVIAKERIQKEIMKIMELPKPSYAFNEMLRCSNNVLWDTCKPLADCIGTEGGHMHSETVFEHCLAACDAVSPKYPLLRLAAMLHDCGKPSTKTIEGDMTHFYGHESIGSDLVEIWMSELRFSINDISKVSELVRKHMFYFEEISKDSTFRRFMSNLKYNTWRDVLRIRIADRRGNKRKQGWNLPYMFKHVVERLRKIEKDNQALKISDLIVNGNDLIKMGFTPGPMFKVILNDILDKVIEQPEFNLDKNAIIEYIHITYIEGEKQCQKSTEKTLDTVTL